MIIERKLRLMNNLVLSLIEEGRKNLGPQSKYIPYVVENPGNEGSYQPILVDGTGKVFLYVNKGRFYRKRGVLPLYKDVTDNICNELEKIYSREVDIQLPSKVAKFCGNISKLVRVKNPTLDYIYKLGKEQFWDIKEIDLFNKAIPFPKVYRFVDGGWKLIDNK